MYRANVNVNSIVKNCKSNQNWKNDKCRCECKNPKKCHVCKKRLYLES